MKQAFLFLLIFLSLSCTSRSQTRRDSLPTTSDTLRLIFVGDLMQHKQQIAAARTPQGYEYASCFKSIKKDIQQADFSIANLEVTLGGKPYSGYPAFSAPDEFLQAIHEAGFNVLLTANNHCLDRGKKGLIRTISLIDSLQIPYAGTYIHTEARQKRYPLVLEKKGFRIALLNYTYGTNGIPCPSPVIVNYIDTIKIAKDIQAAQALQPDLLIACMHWGYEYQSLPNKEQKELANWLFRKGVHHIIGSHPHVVQPIEVLTDSITQHKQLLAYSLGNFISNMSARKTDGGIILKMEFVKDKTTYLSHCEYKLVWTARPVLTQKKNYQILPIHIPTDSLSQNALNRLNIFKKDTRALFKKHNIGIKESFFY